MIRGILNRNFSTGRCLYIRGRKVINQQSNNGTEAEIKTNSIENDLQNSEERLKNLLNNSANFVDKKPLHEDHRWSTLPYVEGTSLANVDHSELDITRQKIDPEDTSIILFPGQGAQFVGMTKSLLRVPTAMDLFSHANEILKYDLSKLCTEGPKRQLDEIKYSHAAIFTASLGCLEQLREERPETVFNCVGTAGFSLGEYTALVFAGALRFEDALQLIQLRAEAIQMAGDMNKGGMISIFYGADSRLKEACYRAKEHSIRLGVENGDCRITNYMFPNFKVVSGSEEALQYIKENMKKFRLRSVKRIKNSPALHCSLMEPAAEPLSEAIAKITIDDPLIKVYSNVHSKCYMSAKHIKKLLPQQIVRPVRWEQTMHEIYARRQGSKFPRTVVCGPGYALKSILKKCNLRAWLKTINVGDIKK